MAADTYGSFVRTSVGKKVAGRLGLPSPAVLRRYAVGDPLLPGPALVGGLGAAPIAERVRSLLTGVGVEVVEAAPEEGQSGPHGPIGQIGPRVAAVVADLTAIERPEDLDVVRAFVGPALKRLAPSGRVVLVGRPPEETSSWARRATRRALEGITRSIGKELRAGATANLVLVAEGGDDSAESTLRFLLSGRSAFVDGQVVRVGSASAAAPADWDAPMAGQVAVVTGAARGIGAAIASVLARDGARIVAVDVPSAGDALAAVANRVAGSALQLDVTASDAGARIVEHARSRHGGLDVVVHNAGITRDRLLANLDESRWTSVLDVNLASIIRMNEAVLGHGGLRDGGHLVLVASIAGIAGNRGQTNYAASKAGVIGLVDAMSSDAGLRSRGITVNAVAPGFIETEMTARIPLGTREAGRRLSSLAQAGLARDVAETIAWFSQDASAAVSGNVVRVCGQSLLGA